VRPSPTRRRPTLWSPERLTVALLTGLVSLATAVAGVLAGPNWAAAVAGLHVAVTLFALVLPAALPFQVAVGLLLAASPLVGSGTSLVTGDDVTVVGVVPLVVGVVATAELLGLSAQMGIVIPRNPMAGLGRVAVTTAVAAATSGLTLAIGALDGPSGLLATLLAIVGCVGFVALLLRPGESASRAGG
jgi:hypothetical protein